jgi:hypothetical protein
MNDLLSSVALFDNTRQEFNSIPAFKIGKLPKAPPLNPMRIGNQA